MINVGMIGTSDGNGHPFSFSAIINGYHSEKIREAGWSVIANYLDEKDSVDIGMPGVVVNSIWTQDLRSSHEIAAACSIQHVCTSPEAMLPLVDAVIIARDDWKSHFPLAMPFLESGISVLIDKPLSLDVKELRSTTTSANPEPISPPPPAITTTSDFRLNIYLIYSDPFPN